MVTYLQEPRLVNGLRTMQCKQLIAADARATYTICDRCEHKAAELER